MLFEHPHFRSSARALKYKYFISLAYALQRVCSLRYLRGDEGSRTPDPLLARQVLSQLSYTPKIWHPPDLPCRLQHSTFGRFGLNHRVRDENGCFPKAHQHQKS